MCELFVLFWYLQTLNLKHLSPEFSTRDILTSGLPTPKTTSGPEQSWKADRFGRWNCLTVSIEATETQHLRLRSCNNFHCCMSASLKALFTQLVEFILTSREFWVCSHLKSQWVKQTSGRQSPPDSRCQLSFSVVFTHQVSPHCDRPLWHTHTHTPLLVPQPERWRLNSAGTSPSSLQITL